MCYGMYSTVISNEDHNRMKYEPLPEFNIEETNRILNSGTMKEIILLPLSVGSNCSNWKTAQDICLKLTEHEDERVSSNAIMGLAYIARNHKKLEKHLVEPILINANRKHIEYLWRIQDAIEDINYFLSWNIGNA